MRILVLVLLSCLPILAEGQHNHFIYIQGDNQQNFYLKKSGEILSSSSSGFIILPKLEPGAHQLTIGFPKDQWPEYEFTIEVKDKDRGFTLKNFQDKGWGLFDMQSMDIIMGRRIEVKKEEKPPLTAMTDDPFSVILASVVNDPRIRETSLISSASMVSSSVTKPAEKQEKVGIAKTDTKPSVIKPAITENKLPEEAKTGKAAPQESKPVGETQATASIAKPVVEEKKLPEGDANLPAPLKETATTAVPPPVVKVESKADLQVTSSEKKEQQVVAGANETQKLVSSPGDTKGKYNAQQVRKISELKTWSGYSITYIDFSGPTPDTILVSIDDTLNTISNGGSAAVIQGSAEPKVRMPRTDCKSMAREKDVLAIRKKMLMLTDDAAMVGVVIREVKTKCFTTEQLQNLSYVFVNDKGRYQLFDEAYPYVFDPANYQRLERLFNNEDYMNRFRSLIKSN